MGLDDFDYELPSQLIARHPLKKRSNSRLMVLSCEGLVSHVGFKDLTQYLAPGDLLVFNDTRVINARIYGRKITGGHVEIMVERIINDHELMAQVKASKALTIGSGILLPQGHTFIVEGKTECFWHLKLKSSLTVMALLSSFGHVPLPPYLQREDQPEDKERYQTIYAKHEGSVAAPTAGLHFDQALISTLQSKGIGVSFITLHVGAGTYQPIRTDLQTHQMHSEYFSVSAATCDQITKTKQAGHRVIAVGTTTLRALESAAQSGELKPFSGETSIFIKPGSPIHCVDGLITNFHLPKSSLLVLVSAFSNPEHIKAAYRSAIEQEYRFYSYGDAMLIMR